MSDERRLATTAAISCIGLLAAMALSPQLWISARGDRPVALAAVLFRATPSLEWRDLIAPRRRALGTVAVRLPRGVRSHVGEDGSIWLMSWSLEELGVPLYPESRVFRSVGRELCRYAPPPDDVVLTIVSRPSTLGGERTARTVDCIGM